MGCRDGHALPPPRSLPRAVLALTVRLDSFDSTSGGWWGSLDPWPVAIRSGTQHVVWYGSSGKRPLRRRWGQLPHAMQCMHTSTPTQIVPGAGKAPLQLYNRRFHCSD